MIAVRVSLDHRPAIVGFPSYLDYAFTTEGASRSPATAVHQLQPRFCWLYRWEFEKEKRALSVAVSGAADS